MSLKTDGYTESVQTFALEVNRQGFRGKLMRELRRLKKVQFFCNHRPCDGPGLPKKIYSIEGFDEKNAKELVFGMKRRKMDGTEVLLEISVADYYLKQYNKRLDFPNLPLVKTRKKNEVFPMELCFIQSAQRYPFKLNERQTADMIKFCVQRPQERVNMIRGNVVRLAWDKDPILQKYGLQVSNQMLQTKARILPVPQIQYGVGSQEQKFAPQGGRWDLRGKKFSSWGPISAANGGGLKCWGLMVFGSPQRIPEASCKAFLRELIKSITGHGGHVVMKVYFPFESFKQS